MEDLKKKLALMEAALRSAENYLCEDLEAICDDVMREYAEDTLTEIRKGLKVAEEAKEPKVYMVYTEQVYDYEGGNSVELFTTKEKAQEVYDEFVRQGKKNAEEDGWIIVDTGVFFEAYSDGNFVADHVKAEIYEVEIN